MIVFRKNTQRLYYYLKKMESLKNLLHFQTMGKIDIISPMKNIKILIGHMKKKEWF